MTCPYCQGDHHFERCKRLSAIEYEQDPLDVEKRIVKRVEFHAPQPVTTAEARSLFEQVFGRK